MEGGCWGRGEWRGLYLDNYAMLPHFRNYDDILEIIINVHGPYRNFEWSLFFSSKFGQVLEFTATVC